MPDDPPVSPEDPSAASAVSSGASHFRGHLFADLRGYTSYIERAGNAAGADLVRRFRLLVRDEVGQHEGAEVKTEGDAIYVVFPSASTAVMCGLAIIEAATEASTTSPEAPIRVGIGVHAGEAVEVPEGGYIGSAVNLASRVCAVAEAGELLVTSTVRDIAQASIPVTFAPRGRRRLKGIADPVELYRVLPHGVRAPVMPRLARRQLILAGLATGALALMAVAYVAWPRAPASTPAASQQPLPDAQTPRIGPLAIGEYRPAAFVPSFTFAVLETGWTLTRDQPAAMSLTYEREPAGLLDVARVSTLYTDPCVAGGETVPRITTAAELLTLLGTLEHLALGDATTISINGRTGFSVDGEVTDSAFAACGGLVGGFTVALFPLGDDVWSVEPGARFKIQAIDVPGGVAAILLESSGGPDVSVAARETFYGLARRIVDSIQF